METKRSAMAEENEAEERNVEAQEEEEEGVEGDAVKTKKPNGFDMFSDDLSMFAEAHSVSNSVVWFSTLYFDTNALLICWYLVLMFCISYFLVKLSHLVVFLSYVACQCLYLLSRSFHVECHALSSADIPCLCPHILSLFVNWNSLIHVLLRYILPLCACDSIVLRWSVSFRPDTVLYQCPDIMLHYLTVVCHCPYVRSVLSFQFRLFYLKLTVMVKCRILSCVA